MKAGA